MWSVGQMASDSGGARPGSNILTISRRSTRLVTNARLSRNRARACAGVCASDCRIGLSHRTGWFSSRLIGWGACSIQKSLHRRDRVCREILTVAKSGWGVCRGPGMPLPDGCRWVGVGLRVLDLWWPAGGCRVVLWWLWGCRRVKTGPLDRAYLPSNANGMGKWCFIALALLALSVDRCLAGIQV